MRHSAILHRDSSMWILWSLHIFIHGLHQALQAKPIVVIGWSCSLNLVRPFHIRHLRSRRKSPLSSSYSPYHRHQYDLLRAHEVESSLLLISMDLVEAPQAPYISHGGVTPWS